MDKPTPRIDQSLTQQFSGSTVRIVGRVESINGLEVRLFSPSPTNDNQITLHISPELHFIPGNWYECVCRVGSAGEVRAVDLMHIEDVDEPALAGLVKFTHRASELFY